MDVFFLGQINEVKIDFLIKDVHGGVSGTFQAGWAASQLHDKIGRSLSVTSQKVSDKNIKQ